MENLQEKFQGKLENLSKNEENFTNFFWKNFKFFFGKSLGKISRKIGKSPGKIGKFLRKNSRKLQIKFLGKI